MHKKKYKGPNRRKNIIDRRQNKWFGWYINWLFAKPLRLVLIVGLSLFAIVASIFLFLSDFKDMCDCDNDEIYFEERVKVRSQDE